MHTEEVVAAVATLWRYPVKSMLGEEINSSIVTPRGLLGDRAYALVDQTTGKIVSAKNPRKWPGMFRFRAVYVEAPDMHEGLPPVRITMPDGVSVTSSQPGLDSLLSRAVGSSVALQSQPPANPKLEEYWPDVENLAHRETVTEEAMPPNSFFATRLDFCDNREPIARRRFGKYRSVSALLKLCIFGNRHRGWL